MHRFLTLFLLLMLIAAATLNQTAAAKYPPVLKQGSKGSETSDLQYRLHTLGYLYVPPTAFFGTLTRKAVLRFQHDHKLRSDGIAGLTTWKALKRRSLSKKEMYMLASVIYGEAGGESYKGQVAVGAVVMNRLHAPGFPKTLRGVLTERHAFSVVRNGQIRHKPNATAIRAAKAAVKGSDPSGNALYYYNPTIATSTWFTNRTTIKRIGNHVFKV